MAFNKLLACVSSARAPDMPTVPIIARATTNGHRFALPVKRPRKWSFLGCAIKAISQFVAAMRQKCAETGSQINAASNASYDPDQAHALQSRRFQALLGGMTGDGGSPSLQQS